jgi:magnesium transporter
MLTDTGGNTGCQSAAVIIRSLALREITPSDSGKIIRKELLVGLLLALTMGLFTAVLFGILSAKSVMPDGFGLKTVGAAIAVALGLQVLISTVTGAALPLLAAKKGYDPALVSSPAITTIVDIIGLLLYFYTVTWILGI